MHAVARHRRTGEREQAAGDPPSLDRNGIGGMSQRKRIQPGARIPFQFTPRERDLVLERAFISPEVEERLRLATVKGAKLEAGLTLDDVDELQGSVAADANHCTDSKVQRQLYVVFDRLVQLGDRYTDEDSDKLPAPLAPVRAPGYTAKQGQYLSFIYYYMKIHRVPPAQADLQRYFRVSPPAVHQMLVSLETRGLIERIPGKPRSIRLLIGRDELPNLE